MTDEPLQNMDVVALLSDRPEEELSVGQTGTVVFVNEDKAAFEVEFMCHSGKSIVTTVRREDLLKLKGLPDFQTGAA